jgi:phosphatidylglycerol---prolipoprotein diacylglyceryl transferase
MAALADRMNRRLDAAVNPNFRLGHRVTGSWRAYSTAAFVVATLVLAILGARHHLQAGALAIAAAVPAALFSADRRRILRSGRPPRLVFHRYVLVSAAVIVPAAAVLGQLSWRLVDIATTAVLAGLAVGRVGCLRAGCCIGRPATIGPRYPWLGRDVRRVPVQLLDSAVCLLLVAATVVAQESSAPGGTAVAIGFGGYAVARLWLDELRDERVRTRRHTEAQLLACVVALAAAATLLALMVR